MRHGALRAAATGIAGMPQSLLLVSAGVLMFAAMLVAAGQAPQRLAVLLVLAPLLEETVFRTGLQDALLRRWHSLPHLANAATAAVFGATHAALRGETAAFAVALPALLIGAVYQRTGRLRLCVALHAAMNAVWLGWSMAGSNPLLVGR